eukprot:TRINITY_DN5510_c2_g1_i1.p1 TRINITY_DN5510_c2_g1~~TRINITY_DN5510_c2_g1_i1.p1  ORF type:complete len:1724 (+),score=604.60 TRINITY_DN5510_c2_g1_i1:405-5174(+)
MAIPEGSPRSRTWMRRRVEEVRRTVPSAGTPDRRRIKGLQVDSASDDNPLQPPPPPPLSHSLQPFRDRASTPSPRRSPGSVRRRRSTVGAQRSAAGRPRRYGAGAQRARESSSSDGEVRRMAEAAESATRRADNTERELEAAKERLSSQGQQLELLRHQLAHARTEADAARARGDRGRPAAAQGSSATEPPLPIQVARDGGAGFYREQLRKVRQSAAEQRADREYHEDLLRAALERPPQEKPPVVKDREVQTGNLDAIDIMVGLGKADSDDSDEDGFFSHRAPVAQTFSDEAREQLVRNIKTAVADEFGHALDRRGDFLFGPTSGPALKVNRAEHEEPGADSGVARMHRLQTPPQNAEEVFYEMCASVEDACQTGSAQQHIQVKNARNFKELMETLGSHMFWPWHESADEFFILAEANEVTRFIVHNVSPVLYGNRPIGYLLGRVWSGMKEAERDKERMQNDAQLNRLGATGAQEWPLTAGNPDETAEREDAEPPFSSWIDLSKKMIVLLSQPKHLSSLNPLFKLDDDPSERVWAPLEFAVENKLDDVVLQICDAQERLHEDAWKVGFNNPLHYALEHGNEKANAIMHMLRAAATVPDDRFGLLLPAKLRLHPKAEDVFVRGEAQAAQAKDGVQPLCIAIMFAHDVSGVTDTLLNLLQKPGRHFKLNFRWLGYHEQHKETWHLLQWCAYQGVERIFQQYHHHPDFSSLSLSPAQKNSFSPLHLACISGAHGVVDVLCREMGGSRSHADALWTTAPNPFHLAAQQCHWRSIAVMLGYCKDKWGWGAELQQTLFGSADSSILKLDVAKLKELKEGVSSAVGGAASGQKSQQANKYNFEFSVYTAALLCYVKRRHDVSQETSPEKQQDLHKKVNASAELVKSLNERHPSRLRDFAQSRIRQFILPWLAFILLITFFAASESQWMTDYEYYLQSALKERFTSAAAKETDDLHSIDDVLNWTTHTIQDIPKATSDVHAVPVGTARLRQIIMSNQSCDIGPSYFQTGSDGRPLPCAGGVSSPRAGIIGIDLLFEELLYDHRESFVQHKDPIQLASGQTSLYKSASELDSVSISSPLGFEYDGGGFVMDFDWGADWMTTLRDFQGCTLLANGTEVCDPSMRWLNSGTRLLVMDLTIFNPATDYYSIISWVFELPAFGGVFTTLEYNSVRLFKYHTTFDYFVLAVNIALVIIICIWTCLTIWAIWHILKGHFSHCSNLREVPSLLYGALKKVLERDTMMLDLTILAACFTVFVLIVVIENEARTIESEFDGHLDATGHLLTNHHYHFQVIASEHVFKRAAIGFVLMLVYLKILSIVRLHRNVGPISIAIVQTLFNRKIAYFGIILVINLTALSFASFFTYGDYAKDFRSFFVSNLAMFRIIFGEYWEYDVVRQQSSVYGPLLLLCMVLFGSLLLINVLTAIIFDIYRDKNQESESNWESDIVSLQVNELMLLLHRIGQEQQDDAPTGVQALIRRALPKAALNNQEIADVIEWNRAGVFKTLVGGVSLFPDPAHEAKELVEFVEEDRTTDTVLRNLNEKVSSLYNRNENLEKQLKGMHKNLAEIHQRLFPAARQAAQMQHHGQQRDLRSVRGNSSPRV